jgi:NADH dehydrogenase FAD-containing subunit
MARKRLVLIGGGHAHMVTLARLHEFVEKGHEVTVIQPSEYHYYSGMGPGMLGDTYGPEEIRFATRKVVEHQGGTFILGKAGSIDPAGQLVRMENSDREIGYDVLSCNAGSYVPIDMVTTAGPTIFTVKPIEGLLAAQRQILALSQARSIEVAIVGGGPSAIEIAGNVQQLGERRAGNRPTVHIFAGRQLLAHLPARIRFLARRILGKRGVRIVEGAYVREIRPDRISLDNGKNYPAEIIFAAVGGKPSPIFARSGLPTGPDGGLLVNRYLQSVGYPNIFGGGDCISFADRFLDKVGVYAVRQNKVLFHNLMAGLNGRELQAFSPGGQYLLIYNLGNETGIFHKWFVTFSGKLAFHLKDYIDRKFIRRFQSMEPRIK